MLVKSTPGLLGSLGGRITFNPVIVMNHRLLLLRGFYSDFIPLILKTLLPQSVSRKARRFANSYENWSKIQWGAFYLLIAKFFAT